MAGRKTATPRRSRRKSAPVAETAVASAPRAAAVKKRKSATFTTAAKKKSSVSSSGKKATAAVAGKGGRLAGNKRRRSPSPAKVRAQKPAAKKAKKPTPQKKAVTPKTKKTATKTKEHSTGVASVEEKRTPHVEQEEVMWEGWKEIYLVGTEWENYDSVFEYNWNFDHLEEALKNGILKHGPSTPYLFGCTEPQLLTVDEKTGQQTVVCVPVIVAVESKLPPPSEVAITSVQRETEDLIPMRNLKMDWVPYFDKADLSLPDNKRTPLAFVLQCNQRREQVAKLPIERLKEYEYALPFLFIPKLNETFPPVDSEVQVIDSVEGVGVSFTYDWKFDELDEFVPELIKQYEFKGDHEATLKKLINDKVEEAKNVIREERRKIRQRLESMPEDVKESLNNLKCYKFYPKNDITNFGQTTFINRYYGHAVQSFPERAAAAPYDLVMTEASA